MKIKKDNFIYVLYKLYTLDKNKYGMKNSMEKAFKAIDLNFPEHIMDAWEFIKAYEYKN